LDPSEATPVWPAEEPDESERFWQLHKLRYRSCSSWAVDRLRLRNPLPDQLPSRYFWCILEFWSGANTVTA